jgi:hypothetical protein
MPAQNMLPACDDSWRLPNPERLMGGNLSSWTGNLFTGYLPNRQGGLGSW